MTLAEAIEEVKVKGLFDESEMAEMGRYGLAIATILNAVVKGELKYDAERKT